MGLTLYGLIRAQGTTASEGVCPSGVAFEWLSEILIVSEIPFLWLGSWSYVIELVGPRRSSTISKVRPDAVRVVRAAAAYGMTF